VIARSDLSTASDVETSLFEQLAGRYPRTVAAFASMPGGERALRAVVGLELAWLNLNRGDLSPEPFTHVQDETYLPHCPPGRMYDVVIAGGGLGLIAGAALAQRGLKVLVFDRGRAGEAHREWNISERELRSLVRHGVFTQEELTRTIGTRYTRGLISFDATGTGAPACPLQLEGVLDVALDAQAVLDLARTRFLEAGGTILEGRTFHRLHITQRGPVASVFEVEGPEGVEFYYARLAIDTMGSVSPIAVGLNGGLPFDGVCPTAGTVMEGLTTDPSTGDVLVSVGPASDGRQLIWEGFPGRGGETTVYLFYYDQAGPKEAEDQSLLWLFEQYFAQLPTYRRLGREACHLRPVFGYIPARYGRSGRTAARGLLCLGDSAAGQSPLTFCGFGSFVRHIGRVASLISFALKHDLLEESDLRAITPHQANLRVAWVFSRFMQPWKGSDPAATNRLMNIFCRALAEIGTTTTTRFLQDRYTLGEYVKIMLTTARFYPKVFPLTAQVLGLSGLLKWAGDLSAFALDDAAQTLHRKVGPRRWKRLERAALRVSPALALRLAAKRTGWLVANR
jgi:lycopene cyclase CruA